MTAWDTSCPDWESRILAGRPLVPDLPLFEEQAKKAVRVFNRLRLPDVRDNPRLDEAAGDWFRDIVRALFGSYDPDTGKRHIQEVFLLVPKKNGKSSYAAAVMLVAAIINQRPQAELLFIAPTKEIADIAFRQASGMIKIDPDLSALFHLQRHIRTIEHRTSGALLQIKAADTDAITGVKATFTLVDETHEFAAKARAADVFVELRGALAARPDGFLFQISTQSKRPPAGVFKAELRKARDVRDGKRKFPLLPVIYELPAKLAAQGAWKDPKNFALVNPNLGRSVSPDFLLREMETAGDMGLDAMALFASQHLDVEIGVSLHADRWPGADYWEGRGDKALTLESLLERSDVVVIGLDGGGLDDLFGLAVIGRDKTTREWLHWGHAWAHESVLERRKSEASRFRDFESAGDLTIIAELGQDIEQICDRIEQIAETGLLPEKNAIGVDPIGIGQIIDELAEREIEGEKIVGISQGYKLNGAIKTAERKLADGTFAHGAQPIMAWAVGNAKVEQRGNAVLITKQAAGTAKIDPLVAMLNAAALMALNPEPSGPSVYESEEFFI